MSDSIGACSANVVHSLDLCLQACFVFIYLYSVLSRENIYVCSTAEMMSSSVEVLYLLGKTCEMLLIQKCSSTCSADFSTGWRALQSLPGLVYSNSKQESHPQIKPEAMYCSLEASKNNLCYQATVYRWREGQQQGLPPPAPPSPVLHHSRIRIKPAAGLALKSLTPC